MCQKLRLRFGRRGFWEETARTSPVPQLVERQGLGQVVERAALSAARRFRCCERRDHGTEVHALDADETDQIDPSPSGKRMCQAEV